MSRASAVVALALFVALVSGLSPAKRSDTSNVGSSVSALTTWANANCANAQGWECAEFAARAIAAGGFIPGLSYVSDSMPHEILILACRPSAPTGTYADWYFIGPPRL